MSALRLEDVGPLVELRWRVVETRKRDRVVAGFSRQSEAEAYMRHRRKIEERLRR